MRKGANMTDVFSWIIRRGVDPKSTSKFAAGVEKMQKKIRFEKIRTGRRWNGLSPSAFVSAPPPRGNARPLQQPGGRKAQIVLIINREKTIQIKKPRRTNSRQFEIIMFDAWHAFPSKSSRDAIMEQDVSSSPRASNQRTQTNQ